MSTRTAVPFALVLGLAIVSLWLFRPGGTGQIQPARDLQAFAGDAFGSSVRPAAPSGSAGGMLRSFLPSPGHVRIPGFGSGDLVPAAGTRRVRRVRRYSNPPARRRRSGSGILLGGGVGMGVGGAVAQSQKSQSNPGNEPNLFERRRVLDLVNQARQANGLMPVMWNEALARAAQVRAQEITRNFSHQRPGGGDFQSVLGQFGISAYTWGENIAQGKPDADAVMASWMNSKGHQGIILDSDFGQLGVGAFATPTLGLCWVQLFIR